MKSWRNKGLALWALAALTVTGCSTTSIPARVAKLATGQVYEDGNIPSSRMMAVAQTFEGQGQYTRARQMYSQILRREPGNRYAMVSLQKIRHYADGQAPPPSFNAPRPAPAYQQTMIAAAEPPKPKQALVAASTVPVRSASRARVDLDQIAPPAPQAAEADWSLPVVRTANETGRTQIANISEPAPKAVAQTDNFVMPVSADGVVAKSSHATFEMMLEDPAKHVGELIADLGDESVEKRANAAFLIGEAGPESAREAIAELRSRLATESSESIRITFAEALGKLGASDAASKATLLAGLHSPLAEVRTASAFALRVFGQEQDAEALDILRDTLMDKDDSVASMAALSLSDFGDAARVAIPDLEIIRTDASAQLRDAIDSALNRIRK